MKVTIEPTQPLDPRAPQHSVSVWLPDDDITMPDAFNLCLYALRAAGYVVDDAYFLNK